MIGKILVTVDGSEHSMKAAEIASDIASACGSKLIILTVIKTHQSPKLSAELQAYAKLEHIGDADFEAIKSLSNDLLSRVESSARGKGVKDIDKKVETGPVARTIVAVAKKSEADIIVIGSRGMGNIEATLLGGVSHRVELLAKCSVLTVK